MPVDKAAHMQNSSVYTDATLVNYGNAASRPTATLARKCCVVLQVHIVHGGYYFLICRCRASFCSVSNAHRVLARFSLP